MINIFLAHASEDKEAVTHLYQCLKERGFEPWLDKVDLLPGQNWRAEIPKAIKASDVFLACLSKESVAKQGYIQREFRMALQKMGDMPPGKIYLIPVRLDDCQIPELRQEEYGINLADYQWVDLFESDGLDRLVKSIDFHFPTAREDELSETLVRQIRGRCKAEGFTKSPQVPFTRVIEGWIDELGTGLDLQERVSRHLAYWKARRDNPALGHEHVKARLSDSKEVIFKSEITTERWLTLDSKLVDWLGKKSQAPTEEAAVQKVFDWLKATSPLSQNANDLILMGYGLGENRVNPWLNDFKTQHCEKSALLNTAIQRLEAGEFNEYIYDGTPKQYVEDRYMSGIVWTTNALYAQPPQHFWYIELPDTSVGLSIAEEVLRALSKIFKVNQDKLKYEGSKAYYKAFAKWFNPTYFGAEVWAQYSKFIKARHEAQFYDERRDAFIDFVAQAIGWSYVYDGCYLRLSGIDAREYYNILILGESLRTLQQRVKYSPPREQYVSELDTAKGFLRWANDRSCTPEIYFSKPLSPYSGMVRIKL